MANPRQTPGGAGYPPLLVLIAAGDKDFREYLLRTIGTHYRVHLLCGGEPGWERDHIAGWTAVDMGETVDAGEMCAAAHKLADAEPVEGILTWDEARVLQAAKVAASLDLPGGNPDAVMACRDKYLARQALSAAGVPQPGFALVASVEEALAAAERIGYPVVLKPRALAASLGVVRVDTPAQLRAQFGFARDTTVPGAWQYDTAVLVEEFLPGPEVSVDSAVHGGEILPWCLARKDVGYPPYFEEVGHLVDAADPLLADDQILRLLRDTHAGLGFTDGMTHTELKLTSAGPKVIEVNARLGGDLIPYLGWLASGVNPGLAAAAVACGRRPELDPSRRRVAGVRFFYPEHDDTTIGEIRIDRAGLPPETELAPLLPPGAVASPPPAGAAWGRVAFAAAVADTAAQCQRGLAGAGAALTITPAS